MQVREIGWWELLVFLVGRFTVNTAFRMVYPLLPFLSVGLGVDLATASLVVTVLVGTGLLSPLGGLLGDRYGERPAMLLGLAVIVAGAAACALAPSFWALLLGNLLIGLGASIYLPPVQSYASARSSYAQRGRVLGILELSWALAALIGVAGLTLVVERLGSVAPAYWAIVAGALITLGLTWGLSDDGSARDQTSKTKGQASASSERAAAPESRLSAWAALRQPGVAAIMSFLLLQVIGVEVVFVSHAAWLERDFGATTELLGLVFALIGLAELGGSGGATLFTDRIGKRRAVLLGFSLMAAAILLLPLATGQLGWFFVLFLLFALGFEFGIVSALPLISGLTARGRGTLIAATITVIGVARIIGSLLGPWLFAGYGFWGNGLVAGGLALVGLAVGLRWLREGTA